MLFGKQARGDQVTGEGVSMSSSVPFSTDSEQQGRVNGLDDRCRPKISFTLLALIAIVIACSEPMCDGSRTLLSTSVKR